MAGDATAAAAAAPVAETFKKSRRFISGISLLGIVSLRHNSRSSGRVISPLNRPLWRGRFNTNVILTQTQRKNDRALNSAHVTAVAERIRNCRTQAASSKCGLLPNFRDLTAALARGSGEKRLSDPVLPVRLNQSRIRQVGSGRCDRALELIAYAGANSAVDRRMRSVRLAHHDGIAGIGGRADRHVQRDFAKERHSQPLSLVPRAAMTENVRARATMRALEIAHVLDNAEHRHIDFLEH